jgi:lipid-A-disaccharide synthase-like uncharacterized protein
MNQENKKAVVLVCLVYFLMELAGITCPILWITGISCAGCGMTRAMISLLKGDLVSAFRFHPLFWMPFAVGIVYLMRERISARQIKWIRYVVAVLGGVTYLIRMMMQTDSVVVFQPECGMIVRMIRKISLVIFELVEQIS